jgi:hypothetical protein
LVCGDKKLNILSLLTGAMSDNNESEIFVFFLINLKGNQSLTTVSASSFLFWISWFGIFRGTY